MTNLLFLVQDCRWSKAYRPANYLVLLLNFLHETGCDGTGCVVGVVANDDTLEFVSALGRGHAGHGDREPSPCRPSADRRKPTCGKAGQEGQNGARSACASWGERVVRLSELENRNG